MITGRPDRMSPCSLPCGAPASKCVLIPVHEFAICLAILETCVMVVLSKAMVWVLRRLYWIPTSSICTIVFLDLFALKVYFETKMWIHGNCSVQLLPPDLDYLIFLSIQGLICGCTVRHMWLLAVALLPFCPRSPWLYRLLYHSCTWHLLCSWCLATFWPGQSLVCRGDTEPWWGAFVVYCERAKVSHIYPNHGSSVEPHLCQSWQFGWKEMPSHSCGFVCLPQLRSFRPVRADVRALELEP